MSSARERAQQAYDAACARRYVAGKDMIHGPGPAQTQRIFVDEIRDAIRAAEEAARADEREEHFGTLQTIHDELTMRGRLGQKRHADLIAYVEDAIAAAIRARGES